MSQRGMIYAEGDQRCEYCGKYDECRPYGKNDEQICFACMKSGDNEVIAKKKALEYLYGEKEA